jgi:nuclear GTP-binding protein
VEIEEERAVGVKQKLGSIMQKNTFLPEDIQRMDDEEEEDESPDEGSDGEDVEEEEEEEEQLSWNDVFGEKDTGVTAEKPAVDEGKKISFHNSNLQIYDHSNQMNLRRTKLRYDQRRNLV